MSTASLDADQEDGFEDYSHASPWERLEATLEDSLAQWVAAGPFGLVDGVHADNTEQLCVTAVSVPYFLPTHTQAYKLHLHFPAHCAADATWQRHNGRTSVKLPLGAHPLTRALGCTSFVLCTTGAGEPLVDADEACALFSALACAAASSKCPWPVVLATTGATRLRGFALDAENGTACRLESAAVSASRPAAWAASPAAQVETLHARVVAASCSDGSALVDAATPHEWIALTKGMFTVRYAWPFPDARTASGGASSAAQRHNDDDDDDDAEPLGLQLTRREGAFAGEDHHRWDAACPWSPWACLAPPFESLHLVACWEDVPATQLVHAEAMETLLDRHSSPLSPHAVRSWFVRATPAPRSRGAQRAVAGADWTGMDRQRQNGGGPPIGEEEDDVGVSTDDGGITPSLGAQLVAFTSTLAQVTTADSMGALASGDWWQAQGTHVPVSPPEHVLQDVLRDIFDAPPLPMAWKVGRQSGSGGAVGEANKKSDGGNESGACGHMFTSLPRCCPPEALLARVALHALTFGNARAVACLWTRVLRELRFSHWETGAPVPRMGVDSCSADGVPDVSACLAHQKLQMLNICIARRAEEAAEAAAAGAEDYERADSNNLVDEARIADAAAAARAQRAADGWEQAWGDEEDGDDAQTPTSPAADGFHTASEGEDEDAAVQDQQPAVQQVTAAPVAATPLFPSGPPCGVAHALPWRLCAWPHMKANAPKTLRPPVMTEDMLRERDLALAALSAPHSDHVTADDHQHVAAARARLQAGPLLSDMCAFKAANLHQGGGSLADFVRWHSPRDWIVEEDGDAVPGDDNQQQHGVHSVNRAPKGRLSDRMAVADGLWAQLWTQATPVAAAQQKPLQDACATGEATLHSLEMMSPADVFAGIFACATTAVGHLLSRTSRQASGLHAAAHTCAAVLQRPCPLPDEWLVMAEAMLSAEQEVSQAAWLHRTLGDIAPGVAHSVLAACAAQPGVQVETECVDAGEKEALVARLGVDWPPSGGDPATREWVLAASDAGHRLYVRVEAGHAEMSVAVHG